MQLRFLGQTYTRNQSPLETSPAEYPARFLGQNYIPRLPIRKVKPQLGLRKYRGISYEA